ncbi:hypothetical protein [Bdellovibrio bacteriovorus]|uniref:hypothetical protein n=1 Tax=Bdellovibrio bacteriovorus TaxID=959 RepID=UPI0035A9A5F2
MTSRFQTSIPLLLGVLLTVYGVTHAAFNWDIIGYVAAVNYENGLRNEALHKATYSEIQSEAPPNLYHDLTEANNYRQTVARSSESLSQHLPFYSIRAAYVSLIRFSSWFFNISSTHAIIILSSIFAGASLAILLTAFNLNSVFISLLCTLIAIAAGFSEISTLATPDSMAATLSLALIFTYRKRPNIATLIAISLPLVRTDFIILSGLIAFCLFLQGQRLRPATIALCSFSAYLTVNNVYSNYGYLKIFNFTLLEINPFPAQMKIEENWLPYVKAYYNGFASFLKSKHFLVYIAYFAFWFKVIRRKRIQASNEQVFIVLSFTLLHMLFFPAYYERFFAWCATIAGLQLVTWIYELKTQKTKDIN